MHMRRYMSLVGLHYPMSEFPRKLVPDNPRQLHQNLTKILQEFESDHEDFLLVGLDLKQQIPWYESCRIEMRHLLAM